MEQQLKKRMRARKIRMARHALAHAVLIGLAATAGVVLVTAPGLTKMTRYLPKENRNPQRIAETIHTLYRKGLVVMTGTRGARKALITDQGRREAYFHSIKRKSVQGKTWDGSWFMVSFDIPATQRSARNGFRDKLKQLGFLQYHKSLYVHPVGHESELDFLVDYYEVPTAVTYFYAIDLKNDRMIKKHFGFRRVNIL